MSGEVCLNTTGNTKGVVTKPMVNVGQINTQPVHLGGGHINTQTVHLGGLRHTIYSNNIIIYQVIRAFER